MKVAFLVRIREGYTREQVQKYYDEVHTRLPGVMEPAPSSRTSAHIYEARTVPGACVDLDASKTDASWRLTEYEFQDLNTLKKAFKSERARNLTNDEGFNRMVEIIRVITTDY